MVKQIVAAYRTQICIQRIFSLSPLRFNSNGDLSTSWNQIVLTYCGLVIFGTCTILIILAIDRVIDYFNANGIVWLVAAFCDLILGKIAYVAIVILIERKKYKQILFFESLVRLDRILHEEFNITTYYAMYQRVNLLTTGSIIVYYSSVTLLTCYPTFCLGVYTEYEFPAMILAFFAEHCVFALIVTIYINGVMLIGNKFYTIKNLITSKQVQNVKKLNKLRDVYTEMFNVIKIWNDYIGWIIMIRLAHDFAVSTTTSYLWFSTIVDYNNKGSMLLNIPVWLLQSLIRILLVIAFAEQAITKVCAICFLPSFSLIVISTFSS